MGVDEAYRTLWPIVRGKCARMLADAAEAEDVAQLTFVKLWRSGIARRTPSAPPKVICAWIYRTSTRLAVDHLRRRRFEGTAAPELCTEATPEGQTIARAALARIARQVPKRELETVVLHRLDGLTQPEVAEVLGVSERTVRRRLARFDERRLEV
ncbi:MAG: RNA polymerase sigma factor [Myxococcota bacterium]